MATVEHCLFCFETLAAAIERPKRTAMTLEEVCRSWAEYKESQAGAGDKDSAPASSSIAKRLPALQRLAGAHSTTSSGSSSPSSGTESPASGMDSSTSLTSGVSTPATSTSSLPTSSPASISDTPLFVTWNTVRSSSAASKDDLSLRGCIGTFSPQPISEGLHDYALYAALKDDRFWPVKASELPRLSVAVTLLTDYEDMADPMDWQLGLHGLRIYFSWRGESCSSTYLPDVAPENDWTKEETIESLMRKGGWDAPRGSSWTDVKLRCVRYQGRKKRLDYPEYRAWRDWVVANA